LCVGFDRIYVYDNDSPDGMEDILSPYIKKGVVVYKKIPGKARQLDAYNDAVKCFKNKTRYMAFLDVDEFLVPEPTSISLKETIQSVFKKRFLCGGIAVNWRVYGSSGYVSAPSGYVIENYRYRCREDGQGNECIKTIANPRFVVHFNHVHYPTYLYGLHNIDENGNKVYGWSNVVPQTRFIRINHYFTKSKEEWIFRRSRGKADTTDETDKRTIDEFILHDNNDILDEIMIPYIPLIKEIKKEYQ
ncbi:MAG: glycosyltransferase family 92 protein, partial [Lachnospiraceae bacterium]|nr:glycosyltransferase family 92 protein [Lachnospiraceae bacterium]